MSKMFSWKKNSVTNFVLIHLCLILKTMGRVCQPKIAILSKLMIKFWYKSDDWQNQFWFWYQWWKFCQTKKIWEPKQIIIFCSNMQHYTFSEPKCVVNSQGNNNYIIIFINFIFSNIDHQFQFSKYQNDKMIICTLNLRSDSSVISQHCWVINIYLPQ